MIELNNVNKIYYTHGASVKALKNICLTVQPGEVVGVVGKSGAGKSTLIRCVNLLERPTEGTVTVAGDVLTSLTPTQLRRARQHIGMIFQQFNLLNSRTVFDNVALPLQLAGQSSAYIQQRVLDLLALVGLTDKQHGYPVQLSGGQKQRVAIARALITDPKILLCDEATSALDPQNTASVLQLLRQINQQLQLTILLITHEMHVIKQVCDRVVILDEGKIVEEGKVANVFAVPQTAIAQYFVDSALKAVLPAILQEKIFDTQTMDSLPVWRIYFRGHAAAEPIIAQLSKNFGLTLNILQANIECIQHDTIGVMVAAVEKNNVDIQAGLSYLSEKGLKVETIGYVARNVI